MRWSSIEAYPEWVAGQVRCCEEAEPVDRDGAWTELERRLLEEPLLTVSVKYDGTCFGKLDDGAFVGRNHVLADATEYLHTSTASAQGCDVAAFRAALSQLLGVELGPVCVYGELMCNPGFYSYEERGLASEWICFGAVVAVAGHATAVDDEEQLAVESARLSTALASHGFAHSVGPGRVRLLLCEALRQLLVDVAGCLVAEDRFCGTTHAEMVAEAARSLVAGDEEGYVVVFSSRGAGQASARKWKNASEGQGVGQRHALELRRCQQVCEALSDRGSLDPRMPLMLATMASVAEANTQPKKACRRRK